MAGFPGIPSLIGDTDDDASIHLNSKVGPAKPLPRMSQKEQEIADILNKPNPSSETKYNQLFESYIKNGGIIPPQKLELPEIELEPEYEPSENESDSADDSEDDEETEVESDEEDQKSTQKIESIPVASEPPQKHTDTYVPIYGVILLVFVAGLAVFFLVQRGTPGKTIENYYEVNSKFKQLDNRFEDIQKRQESKFNNIDSILQELTSQQLSLENNVKLLTDNFLSRFTQISEKLSKLTDNSPFVKEISAEFQKLKAKVESIEVLSNHEEFDRRLDDLNAKLDKIAQLSDNIESVKRDVLKSLVDSLPELLPVYKKDGKIHFIPEFNKFLYNFVDSYFKEHGSDTWKQFISNNQEQLNQYVNKIIADSGVSGINQKAFYQLLNEKLNENNKIIFDKFNSLVDSTNITTNQTLPFNGDQILLDNLLEIFAKGSVHTNYADYKLGARILGFLTTVPVDSRALTRKLFLGWYDFLKSSTPSIKSLKYNANNLLVDGGATWECESTEKPCTVGIRLANPVIVTDVVIKSLQPSSVSIYIRPKSKLQYHAAIEYLNKFKINFQLTASPNKYLKKFVKVKEAALKGSDINHVKLPVSLVNLRIPSSDIYLEFHGNRETIEVHNLKVYGISEYNSYKYSDEFDLILSTFKSTDEPLFEFDDIILGQDEIV